MISVEQQGTEANALPITVRDRPKGLSLISELGRGLLSAVHPKKIASKAAESIVANLEADICMVAVVLDHIGMVCVAVDPNGQTSTENLDRTKFKKWIGLLPSRNSFALTDSSKFFIEKCDHASEYIAPLHINGEVKGAIITGFANPEMLDRTTRESIDAATQMTALGINLTAHYEATLDSSIHEAKEEHRKFTESVLDSLPVSLYVIDKEYNIVMWNRHREIGIQGMPRDSVIGRNVFDILTKYPQGKMSSEFERAFKTGKIERIEQQTADDDGATRHWMVSKVPMLDEAGRVSHVITVGEDVTMRVEAIHAVGRAEKLAAVGRLAAGVVHEINNPLATISACAEALESRLEEGAYGDSVEVEDLREYLGLIRSEAFRCKSITTGLLDFSRVRTGNRNAIDLGSILESSAKLVNHQNRGEDIEIVLDISPELPQITADEGQLQQAIIALATNAIDAMPDGGTLTFKADCQRKRVLIEISDTGFGIEQDDISKIFEPFFTTKEVGKGTGLGLAVCYGIITDHEGRLSVRSNPKKGTTFTITLPVNPKSDGIINTPVEQ